jgi:ABC-type Fe3+-siderophore transport system permease subunit
VDLAQSNTNKISDSSLLALVVAQTLVFVISTIYSPGVKNHVQIDRKSSIVTLAAFAGAVIAFIVIEILTEIGDDGLL